MAFVTIVAYEFNLKESLVTRSRVFSPWTAFYFLQSLLINLGLGYPSVCSTPLRLRLFCFCYGEHCLAYKKFWSVSVRWWRLVISLCSAYGAPNFNTLLALHSTNMEESTEILTIFPWYSYMVGIFIFVLGVIAIRRKKRVKKRAGIPSTACVWYSVWRHFCCSCAKPGLGRRI